MDYVPPLGAADPDAPYINGNPSAGIQGSVIPAAALENPQREIVNAIRSAGLDPDPEDKAQLFAAIQALVATATARPITMLPFPQVETADRTLTINPVVGAAGGTVSLATGTALTLCQAETATTGRVRRFETAAYVSADLDADSTYFLRAKVDDGALQIYTQKGTDEDGIPVGLVGTPDAGAGGGFDSTALDALLARVVTGAAGTLPTVTALANAARLSVSAVVEVTGITGAGTNTARGTWQLALDWARRPKESIAMENQVNSLEGITDWDRSLRTLTSNRYLLAGDRHHTYIRATGNLVSIFAET